MSKNGKRIILISIPVANDPWVYRMFLSKTSNKPKLFKWGNKPKREPEESKP